MRTIWIIFGKELKDTLRDRRTLSMMILVPLVLVPVIVVLVTQLQAQLVVSARAPLIRVAVVNQDAAKGLADLVQAQDDMRLTPGVAASGIPALIRNDKIDAAFLIHPDFDERVQRQQSGQIEMFYESDINVAVTRERLREVMNDYREQILRQRLADQGLDGNMVEVVSVEERDVARRQVILGRIFGGILPYFFIIFCYLGAMYPAIDLAAGEKERATMETLLTSPASRFQIAAGKFWVVVLCGFGSALVSILGLYLGFYLVRDMPPELTRALEEALYLDRVAMLALILLPLAMCFAGLMLSFSIFARSFKEAQSILSPLAIITVLPAVVGLLPGIELTPRTALFPMLNVSIAMKEIIAGTVRPVGLMLVWVSLGLLAILSLLACAYYFRREDVIFRS
ncbi:MAG: ABC transporter permease [Bacteroidetes bacterium]|jgi:sodium transport system permease protein|nr:ABC transporter permease [Bacteroidota bacterium]